MGVCQERACGTGQTLQAPAEKDPDIHVYVYIYTHIPIDREIDR